MQLKRNKHNIDTMEIPSISSINFYGQRYKRLGQAVEQINSTDDNTPVSILLIPPEVDIQTDEEDVDDDDLLSSSIPKDVPGEVEVVYDSDEDDDTISLSIIQDMLHKARHNPKNTKTHVPNWSDDLENLEEMEGTYTPEIICKLANTHYLKNY
ncbi:hypothetical protein RN001_011912 [Aquatica leii]|uniref:Uncharacterized protein n=1 Tax=Aquatica leii TaxID=1421715 RepID=A0AAN7SPA1_9COLE|nr:hypothetical protein RN001_011912 [Aquatica leii]